MKYQRFWWAVPAILLVTVSALGGAVVTGLLIGAENEIGARVLRVGSPLMIAFALLLVVSTVLVGVASGRLRRG